MMTAATPQPGELLAGRYRVEAVLGRGGFGVTVAAVDTSTGMRVAVKRLDLRHVDDWKSVQLFEREAEVLRRLSHSLIPDYVAFHPIAADRAGLLVQELAPGHSLQAYLDSGRVFSERETTAIAAQLLDVLIYLSELRPPVVHRDIKPANAVMNDDGTLYLVDFGAVAEAAARASTIGSTVAGTFGYMAPEQSRGTAGTASDLYSVGMTMIALLTGTAPTDLPAKRLKPSFRDAAQVSAPLATFIDRLIEPVPEDRFATAREARGALDDAVAAATFGDPGADIGALVQAQELAIRQQQRAQQQQALSARNQSIAKLAQRRERVSVKQADGRTRIVIAPEFMSDKLKAQAGWGFGFAFVNPGVFIMMGLGALYTFVAGLSVGLAIPLAVVTWAILLTLINVGFARLNQRQLTLDITDDGHFAMYERSPKQPLLLGRTQELTVDLDEPDPSRLGTARFQDARRRLPRIEKLSSRDLETLHHALRGRCRLE